MKLPGVVLGLQEGLRQLDYKTGGQRMSCHITFEMKTQTGLAPCLSADTPYGDIHLPKVPSSWKPQVASSVPNNEVYTGKFVAITMSKELLGHTATQTETGRTDLPSGASWQYNLPSETAYSVSLLMNIRWCFVPTGCSHGSARVSLISETLSALYFLHFIRNTYILTVTRMDKVQLP